MQKVYTRLCTISARAYPDSGSQFTQADSASQMADNKEANAVIRVAAVEASLRCRRMAFSMVCLAVRKARAELRVQARGPVQEPR